MYKDKKVIHIVCTGKNGEIGYDYEYFNQYCN